MPLYRIDGPDGHTYEIEGPEGATQEQIVAAVQAQLANKPAANPQSGFMPALKAGIAGTQQDFAGLGAELGLRSTEGAQSDIDKLEAYKNRTFQPTEQGWSEAPFTKIGELAGQSLPYMAAPVAAGIAAGPIGAGAMSALQFTGTNLSRQRQEGTPLGQGQLGPAAAAAIPQAALDMVGLKMIPGIRQIFASAGHELTAEGAKKIAEQGLRSTLGDYVKHTGEAVGVEGLTEAAQQVFERMQAGLSLTDPAAQKEYFDNFVGGAVLGGMFSVPGRAMERGQAKRQNELNVRADQQQANQLAQQQEQDQLANTQQGNLETGFSQQQDQDATQFANDSLAKMREMGDLAQPPAPEQTPSYDEWKRASEGIGPMLEQAQTHQKMLHEANAPMDERIAAAQQITRLQQVKDQIDKIGKTVEPPPQAKIDALQKAIQKKVDLGQSPENELQQLAELTKGQDTQTGDLFAQDQTSDEKLGEEMGQGREQAQAQSAKVQQEIEALRRIGDHNPNSPEYMSTLYKAMGAGDDFVRPEEAGTTLHLPPDRQKAVARQKLQEMKQKEGDTSPFTQWMQNKVQQMLDQRLALQAQDNQQQAVKQRVAELQQQLAQLGPQITQAQAADKANVGTPEAQQLTRQREALQQELEQKTALLDQQNPGGKVLPAKANAEPQINLSDESDKRVDPLIDRLLQSSQQNSRTGPSMQPGPTTDDKLRNVFDGAPSLRVVKGQGPEAFPAERVLAQLRPMIQRLKDLNAQKQRLGGKLTDPAKIEAKQAIIEEMRALGPQVQALKQQWQQQEGTARPKPGEDATVGPELPASETSHPNPNPNQQEMFAAGQQNFGFPTQVTAAERPDLQAAQQAALQARNQMEELRKEQLGRYPNPLDHVQLREAQAEVERRDAAVRELQQQLGQQDRTQAAQQGQSYGQFLGNQINQGDTNGYRDYQGRPLGKKHEGTTPKNPKSWDQYEKSKPQPPGAVAQAAALVAKMRERLGAAESTFAQAHHEAATAKAKTPEAPRSFMGFTGGATEKMRKVYAQQVAKLLKGSYNTQQANAIYDELGRLAEAGTLPDPKLEEKIRGANATEFIKELTYKELQAKEAHRLSQAERSAELSAAESKAKELYDKYLAARKKVDNDLTSQAGLTYSQFETVANAAERAEEHLREVQDKQNAPTKQLMAYQQARADRLAAEAIVGDQLRTSLVENAQELKKIRNTTATQQAAIDKEVAEAQARLAETDKMRKAADAAYEQARANREAVNSREHNAPRLEYQKSLEKMLAEDRANKEARIRQQTGAGLPGVRHGRDTMMMTPAENELKRQLAVAEAAVTRLEGPVAQREEASNRLKALQRARESGNFDQTKFEGMAREASELAAKIKTLDSSINPEQLIAARKRAEELQRQVDSIYSAAPSKTEEIGKERPYREPPVIPGARLSAPVKGPLVRNISGANKKASQSGRAHADLRSAGLDMDGANALTIYVLKNRMEAATGDAKTELEAEWKHVTEGVSDADVKKMYADGKELAGLGPTAKLIAARQAIRETRSDIEHYTKEANKGTEVERAIARDKLEKASALDKFNTEEYTKAKEEYENSQIEKVKNVEEELAPRFEEQTATKVKTDTFDTGIKGKLTENVKQVRDYEGERRLRDQAKAAKAAKSKLRSVPASAESRAAKGMDEDTLYRTSTESRNSMTRDAVDSAAQKIKSGWKNAPDVVVVQSESELPFSIAGHEGKTPGLYHNGEVYLIADNISDVRDVGLTMAHEVAGHYGLRSMLGDAYASTMNTLYNGNDKVRQQADAKMKAEGLSKEVAVEEVLAEMAETNPADNALKRAYYAVKQWLSKMLGITHVSDGEVAQIVANARRHVERDTAGGRDPGGAPVYRTKTSKYDVLIGKPQGAWAEARNIGLSNTYLKFRTITTDMRAASEEGINRAEKAGKIDHQTAIKAHYAMRFGDQINQAVAQMISHGPLSFVKDKLGVDTYKSTKGASLQQVFAHVGDMARHLGVDHDEGTDIFTTLEVGQRAEAIKDGWTRLTDKPEEVKALYADVKQQLAANPKAQAAANTALKTYKEFNDAKLDFLHAAGAITDQRLKELKSAPYAPWYRIDDGKVQLVTEREHPVTIGNLKDQPELADLLGSDKKVMNILDSSVKNTYLIARMAMRNKQTTELVDALYKAGFISKATDGTGPSGKDVVHYKIKGEDYWARIDQDAFGIPAELVAAGMEGIKTTLPAVVKMMGIPAHWVRSFVTRSPAYAVRQLMRDPINSVFMNGLDTKNFLGAFKHMGESLAGTNATEQELMHSLVVTSNIYSSSPSDVKKFVLQAAKGNANAADKALLKLDEIAQQADAATRNALYEDSIQKGLSHSEASLRALESMNFNRRGLSPSMHMISTMIPFFNAQVQGLDVLARSLSGKMPFNDRLDLQKKLYMRALMLTGATFAYAALMRDDEDYAKLKPQDRYQNFHVRVPGVKDFVKIPIPYEFGAIFKALPEAILDYAYRDTKGKDAAIGFAHVLANSLPNLQPSAVAPLVMASLNYSGFGPIESHREQQLEPGNRYRDTTPEALKAIGKGTNISPLMMEFFFRSYTGTMGLGIMRMLGDPVVLDMLGKQNIAKPTGTEADMPFVGGLFQRKEGRFLIDRAYDDMEAIHTAQKTFDELKSHGEMAEAKKYAQEKSAELALAQVAGAYRRDIGQSAALERQIRNAPNKTAEWKDAMLKKVRDAENRKSQAFYAGVEKTKALADQKR